MKISFLFLLTLICGAQLKGQNQDLFKKETFISKGDTLDYRILYPPNYNSEQAYPFVLFLHGAGERGNDNEKQLVHGSSLFLQEENRKKFPAIVVFPQCDQNDYWSNVNKSTSPSGQRSFDFTTEGEATQALSMVLKLIDSLVELPSTNKSKIYVAGLSMGGMGTFEMVSRRPELFAAAIPICGGGNPAVVDKYADNVSFWIFHGAKDDIVDPAHSKKMYEALKARNADVKFTLFPEANHNSWDPAFAQSELLPWLFSKSK